MQIGVERVQLQKNTILKPTIGLKRVQSEQ